MNSIWIVFFLLLPCISKLKVSAKLALLKEAKDDTSPEEQVTRVTEYMQAHYELEWLWYWVDKQGAKIYDGPNFRLFQLFQEKYGTTLKRVKESDSFSVVKRNGSYAGELGLLQRATADVSSNAYFYTTDRFKFADYSVPVQSSPYCIIAGRAPLMPFAQVLLLPFRPHAWLAIMCSLFFTTLVWFPIDPERRKSKNLQFIEAIACTIFYVARVFLTGGYYRSSNRLHQRFILGALVMFCFVIASAYQGKLLGFLTAPPHLKEPQTLDEAIPLLDRIFTYGLPINVIEDERRAYKSMREKLHLIDIHNIQSVLKGTVQGLAHGVVSPTILSVYFASNVNLTVNGEILLYQIAECMNEPGFLGFLTRKNSPMKEKFGRYVMSVVEGELYNHWLRAQRHRLYLKGVLVPETTGEKPRPLKHNQLIGAFLVLVFGYAVSIAAFIAEMIFCEGPVAKFSFDPKV